jgi:hypothetical protein
LGRANSGQHLTHNAKTDKTELESLQNIKTAVLGKKQQHNNILQITLKTKRSKVLQNQINLSR